MTIKTVLVAGSGVLGSQIAFQAAYKGFDVHLYDLSDEILDKARENIRVRFASYKIDLGATDADLEKGYARITTYTDLAEAVKDADVVIEAVPERMDIKENFYKTLAEAAGPDVIFASNSSTLLPSALSALTDRPEKFLNFHFANLVWRKNTVEIMGSPATSEETRETMIEFGRNIGMVPIILNKEQPGYVLNTLLVPWLNRAIALLADGITDAKTIDKVWRIATGDKVAPFFVLDIIGVNTPYAILSEGGKNDPEQARLAEFLKENYLVPQKKFYEDPSVYVDPAFLQPAHVEVEGNPRDIDRVMVAGSGVLGGQIALACAMAGKNVQVWDIDDEVLIRNKSTIEGYFEKYKTTQGIDATQFRQAMARMSFTSDLKQAANGVQLVIEAVPASAILKQKFYQDLVAVADDDVIFASNSSTSLPSRIAEFTGRPETTCNLSFANAIWSHNLAEVMGCEGTSQDTFASLVRFAESIGMVAVPIYKEHAGYVMDSMLAPWLIAAGYLVAAQITDYETVDRVWMINAEGNIGPIGYIDVWGTNTASILVGRTAQHGSPAAQFAAGLLAPLLQEMVENGQLGMFSGQGFYTYPNAAWEDKESFLAV